PHPASPRAKPPSPGRGGRRAGEVGNWRPPPPGFACGEAALPGAGGEKGGGPAVGGGGNWGAGPTRLRRGRSRPPRGGEGDGGQIFIAGARFAGVMGVCGARGAICRTEE